MARSSSLTPRAAILLLLATQPIASSIGLPGCSTQTTAITEPDAGAAPDASATPDTTTTPAARTTPATEFLPKVTGACPDFVAAGAGGKASFAPGGKARDVQLWVTDAAKTKDGPVVFFWHGAGGSPTEASGALSPQVISAITAAGGIVAAPYHDPAAGQLPWFLALGGSQEDDLAVMDEVVACAIKDLGIDPRRIHSVGFSAGAMNTMQAAWRRSGYIASIVAYSGATIGEPPVQDPTNLFPALVTHGGPSDRVLIRFEETTVAFRAKLKEAGHFAALCAHGKGHTVPSDLRASAWKFLQDHPYGTRPSPYAAALPEGFPSYCEL